MAQETAVQRATKSVVTRLRRYYDPASQSPEAQRARVDPIYFGERYVRPNDARWTKDTQEFQMDMVQHLLAGTRFDPEIIKEYPRPADAKENSSIGFRTLWIPIEHTKTPWLSIVIPLWTLAVDQVFERPYGIELKLPPELVVARHASFPRSEDVHRAHVEQRVAWNAQFLHESREIICD